MDHNSVHGIQYAWQPSFIEHWREDSIWSNFVLIDRSMFNSLGVKLEVLTTPTAMLSGLHPVPFTLITTIGVLAGLVQFLGLIRWPFLVTSLADIYTDPESTQATRDSVAVVFQAFHRYAGVAIGEHLGYIFTNTWTILLCIAIIATDLVNPLFGWLGIVPAIGVLIGVFEETGFKPAGAINAISYILWSVWLIALGIALLLR